MENTPRSSVIFDASPLITLAAFSVENQLLIHHFLALIDVVVAETVADEATANPVYPDAKIIRQLRDAGRITTLTLPVHPLDSVINEYTKLGQGERDTIRLGLLHPNRLLVMDDYLAFVVATRFDLKPILLLDLMIWLVSQKQLNVKIAAEMIDAVASRYSSAFVAHTHYKLKALKI